MKKATENQALVEFLTTDLEKQKGYAQSLKAKGDQSYALILAEAFVRGMRDSGYRSTATAIDEFIDNAIQSGARRIDVAYTHALIDKKHRITNIAVIDNGHGMEPDMLRASILWGGTHRENDRSGFGRYGFGLPSAAISISKEYEVYSKVPEGDWFCVRISLDEISSGALSKKGSVLAPLPERKELPKFVKEYLKKEKQTLTHGTVVVLNNPDNLTSGFVVQSSFHKKLIDHIGLVYRWLLKDYPIFVGGNSVSPVDPLFLDLAALHYDVGNGVFAQSMEDMKIELENENGQTGIIKFRFSYMPDTFQLGEGGKKRYSIMRANNAYFIVTRAGRQIDLVEKTDYPNEKSNTVLINFDRNWAIELDFDPVLDKDFGITVNKQQVTISERLWQIFETKGIPAIVKSLRKKFRTDKSDRKSRENSGESRTALSETVMAEAEKYFPKKPKTQSKQQTKKISEAADKHAKETGKTKDEAVKDILTAAQDRPYKIGFETLEGAPFYRVELFGPQKRIFINTRHRFYTDLYDCAEATPRLQASLELLIYALGISELFATEERAMFYLNERLEWSRQLETALRILDTMEPSDDAKSAKLAEVENE